MLLAIDTSTNLAGVALHGSDGPIGARAWRSERRHTQELLPAIDALLRGADLAPTDLSGVGVATGPGSFTSVRVGISVAKGIAAALGLPLVGISTLDYTAAPYAGIRPEANVGAPSGPRRGEVEVRAVLPLGRGRVAVAAYAMSARALEHRWTQNLSLRAAEPGDLAAGRTWFYCGEIERELRDMLAAVDGVAVVPEGDPARDPAVLARLAWERLLQGATDPPAALQAEYLDTKAEAR